MSLNLKEYQGKDMGELRRLLDDKQRELRGLKARALAHDLKGVRSVRALRKEVAQLYTLLNARASASPTS